MRRGHGSKLPWVTGWVSPTGRLVDEYKAKRQRAGGGDEIVSVGRRVGVQVHDASSASAAVHPRGGDQHSEAPFPDHDLQLDEDEDLQLDEDEGAGHPGHYVDSPQHAEAVPGDDSPEGEEEVQQEEVQQEEVQQGEVHQEEVQQGEVHQEEVQLDACDFQEGEEEAQQEEVHPLGEEEAHPLGEPQLDACVIIVDSEDEVAERPPAIGARRSRSAPLGVSGSRAANLGAQVLRGGGRGC